MIYLDNAATTRVFERSIEATESIMRNEYFNPNATYKSGVASRERIDASRRIIADAIGASADELVFTSCATESNNWVFSCGLKNRKGNVVISAGEHASVYEPAMQLKNRGVDVRIAPLDKNGGVDETALSELVDENTTLVSVIHVSNETGVVNNISRISAEVKRKAPKCLVHSDGVQGLLKTDLMLRDAGVDFYSASAHKIGAPKGIGLLYIKKGIGIAPYMLGGGQESGRRSGTQNTPYIAAFAAAVNEFNRTFDIDKIIKIRSFLAEFFAAKGYKIIGNEYNSGFILCVCIPGVKAEILQNMAFDKGVIIGKGAACSGSKRGNRVLSAIGLSQKDVECCFRISLFSDTDIDSAQKAAEIIVQSADAIRSEHVK